MANGKCYGFDLLGNAMAAAVASAPAADVVGVQLGIANALGTATTLLMQCAGCIFLHGTKHQAWPGPGVPGPG